MVGRALCRLGLHRDRWQYRLRGGGHVVKCTGCGRYATRGSFG